jgi:hypothetical protein
MVLPCGAARKPSSLLQLEWQMPEEPYEQGVFSQRIRQRQDAERCRKTDENRDTLTSGDS